MFVSVETTHSFNVKNLYIILGTFSSRLSCIEEHRLPPHSHDDHRVYLFIPSLLKILNPCGEFVWLDR